MWQVLARLALLGTIVAGSEVSGPLRIEHVCMVAPDVVSVTVRDGEVEYGRQVPYEPLDGDVIDEQDFPHRWLMRNGQPIGAIAGEHRDILFTFDQVHHHGFDGPWASDPGHWALVSADDPAYRSPQAPTAVYRKTKPTDMGRVDRWSFDAPLQHTLYLHLPEPLSDGRSYTLELEGGALPPQTFSFSSRLRSEAIHLSQIGFRPDDPVKVGFLSCWMGDGGGLAYIAGRPFFLVGEGDGRVSFEGVVQLSKAADDYTEDAYNRNYNGTDIYLLDFSAFAAPGSYRLVVPGVGCSYPLSIRPGVWEDAFYVSARGFYHMRSGIALGPPHTEYERPCGFHADEGQLVYASTASLLETGNGPLAYDVEETNFGNLVRGRTDTLVPDAWGGTMDAGDWDRRAQHLVASQLLLELALLFPEFSQGCLLNIPESQDQLPDIVNEALFNLDFYRRLQTPQGGVRGGIESEEHPRYGETSWQESLTVLAYAPGRWTSYQYAGTAARAALWFDQHAPTQALLYRESALRAMEWAEAHPAQPIPAATAVHQDWAKSIPLTAIILLLGWQVWRFWPSCRPRRRALAALCLAATIVTPLACHFLDRESGFSAEEAAANALRDARNYAAAEMFRLTGDPRWHDVFRNTSSLVDPQAPLYQWQSHDQEHGAWVFARTERPGMDQGLKENCRNAILRTADQRLATCEATGFRWTKYPWRPFGSGIPSAPDAVALVRAHVLTGDENYLRGALLACQVGAGANPTNLCFTTGIGWAYPQHALHLDSRLTHQPPPPGLTVLGPRDITSPAFAGDWGRRLLRPHCYPELESWPPIESYMDVFWNSPLCEFTIHLPMATNAYVWGYLAARA